ncbi:hypothetical protein [Nannocystis pusilla]|uniref:hypothetical protein n=1 Tax=Nannocystis pusilla TaxID=889268 RepID=UPI003B7F12A8
MSFVGLYFCLNIVPLMLLSVPLLDEWFGMLWLTLWVKLMPILGNAALGIEGPISMEIAGSSDMTWNYVQQFWYLVLAVVGAIAWAALPHRRLPFPAQYAWLRIVVRHGLAMMMLSYGFIKVFGTQMPPLGPAELSRTYGESSPGGLLWSFMGFSPFYKGFTGMAEVIGGAAVVATHGHSRCARDGRRDGARGRAQLLLRRAGQDLLDDVPGDGAVPGGA